MAEKLQFDLDVANNNLKKALNEAITQVSKIEQKTGSIKFDPIFGNQFVADAKKANSGIDEVGKTIKGTSQETESFGTAASVAIGGLFVSATLSALSSVRSFAEGSIQAYSEQELAISRLNAALASTGQFTEATSQALQGFANDIQKTTRFSDDATLGALGLLQSLVKLDAEGLQRAGTGAADLAARFGKDLPGVVETLGRAFNGQTKGLREFGIQFKDTGDRAQNFEGIMKIVNERFGGSAQKDLDTYSAKQAQLANKANELQEALGKLAVQSGAAGTFQKAFDNIVTKSTSAIERLNLAFQVDGPETYAKKIQFLTNDLKLLEQTRSLPGGNDDVTQARIKNINDEIILTKALAEEELKRSNAKRADAAIESVKNPAAKEDTRTQERIDSELKAQIEIDAINAEAYNVEAARQEQLTILQISSDEERATAELEFIESQAIAKADLKYQKQIEENELLATTSEQLVANKKAEAERLLAIEQANSQKQIAAKKAMTDYDSLTNKQRVANLQSTLGVISTLSASGNKELAAIGKAAAVSTATIDGIAAVQKALASAPPPLNFALAGLVGVATAVNVAKIASTPAPSFEDGGIVPGNSFSGDRVRANVNSGELILNRAQQDNLVNQFSQDNRPIIVQIDGVAVFNAVRTQIQSGRRLA